jgi:hypothetical protein
MHLYLPNIDKVEWLKTIQKLRELDKKDIELDKLSNDEDEG